MPGSPDPATALVTNPNVAVDLARALKHSTFAVAADLDVDDPKVAVSLLRATAASGATIGVPNEAIFAVLERSLRETGLIVRAAEPTSPRDAPVIGWGPAARALGISSRSLARRRAEHHDTSEPWWQDTAACRAWFAHLLAPTPMPTRSPKATHRPMGDPPRAATPPPEGLSAAALRDRWSRR